MNEEKVYRKDGTEIDPKAQPITYCYALWEKHATPEEKQRFCDEANSFAKVLRKTNKNVQYD